MHAYEITKYAHDGDTYCANMSADMADARRIYAEIGGTWTHGTLRTVDLLDAAARCAESLATLCPDSAADLTAAAAEARAVIEQLAAIDAEIDAAEDGDGPSPIDLDRARWGASETLEAITDEINAALPAPLYYGCTEGDGSDIGIWCSAED